MKDEEFMFKQDVKEKAFTARSARNRRTHTGKGGRVRFPSDHMTRKELKAMSGEVKAYRLNNPMTWAEFKEMPDDIKVSYIKLIRERFAVPDKEIADMLGVDRQTVGRWFRCLGLGLGKCAGGHKTYDKEGWLAWCNGLATPTADPVKEDTEEVKEPANETPNIISPACGINPIAASEQKPKTTPRTGSLTFEGQAENALDTVAALLGCENVRIHIAWEVLPEDEVY